MDGIPLLKAKLAVPEIPGRVLFSERIKNLKIAGYRVVIITAPAGFGKTTAVLLSLRNNRAGMRWYRMEREDSVLPVFYAHLLETLFGRDKGTTDSARSLASVDKLSEEYHLLNAVICQDVWTRYSDRKSKIYLILDDFQNSADNPAIVETVNYFVSNLPPNLRIIVMSRVDTGIPTGKLSLNGDILRIGEEALRFSQEEIAKLTGEIYKIKIESGDLYRMHEYSEGWIAGITMLIHAAGPNLLNLSKLFSHEDNNRQNVFRYFLNEALGGTNKDMLKTLACISMLADFTCDDLEAVFHMENAAETLAWLEQNNLYIQKIKAQTTSYRFHSLFRSALLSVLYELFTPDEIKSMNLNAAYHYKNLGDFALAIRFLLAAGRTEEAVNIASIEGVRFMDTGDADRVTSLIQEFPEEEIGNNQCLVFLRGAALMNTELDQSYSNLSKSLVLALQSGNLNLQMKAVGLIISICSQKNDHRNIAGAISQLPKFKLLALNRYARITLLISAFMKAAWSDELALGKALYRFIDRLSFYEPLWDYGYKMAKGMIAYRSGNFPLAGVILDQVLNHPTALINDRWKSIGLVMCQSITSLTRNVQASQKLVGELASIGEKYDSSYAKSYAYWLSAYTKFQTRDILSAVAIMAEAENSFAVSNNPIMICLTRMMKYLWKAEDEAAGPLSEKAAAELKHLEALKPSLGYLELCQVIAGALCKEAGNYPEAERLLSTAFQASKRKKAPQSMCGAAMHLADLYYRQEEQALEDKYLQIWGRIAAKNGYVYFREMNYPTLVRVCARCLEKNIYPDHMLRIISEYFDNNNAARLAEAPVKVANDPKSFISGCSTPPKRVKVISIKLFGNFKMVVDNLEISEKEWKTRKISGILKYILANPGKTVSREALTTAFWPDSDSKAASISLRVALFELRKILARFGMGFESEDALLSENKNGFSLCSRHILEIDTDRFTGLYRKYKAENLPPEKSKILLEQMIELYEGDFLEHDSYDEWVALSREHYKSIFIEASHQLSRFYLAGGESQKAEDQLKVHLKIDPLDERACGMLIRLYDSTDRKSQAASLRRRFEKRFEAEMGVKPDLEDS